MTPTDKASFLTAMQLLTQQVVAIQQGPTPPPDGMTTFLLPGSTGNRCGNCGATTGQACNDSGCFYLESGNGEPQA